VTDALWFLGRGTGVVSLVLLSLVVALGVATRSGRPLPGLPRFAVAAVHRSAALLAVAFLVVHVTTLLFDPYAQLDLLALVVPFTAQAEPFWYGLGALALDLVVALVATSLLRARLGPRAWRAVHWLAYAAWPVAVLHGIGSGSDAGTGWLLAITGVCVAGVLAAVAWRLRPGFAEVPEPAPAAAPVAAPRIGAGVR
jgi:methionine sulfoxide reductase heme-binding subunit